jgi:hypothetical protein
MASAPDPIVTAEDQQRLRTYWNTYGPHRGEIRDFIAWDDGTTFWDDGATTWPE